MPVRLYVYRFVRKFVFDVLPAALASLVGALFFAHQWTQTPARVEAARVSAQNEQIVTMIRDEQTLMRAFLEREQDIAVKRQTASAAKEPVTKEPADKALARDKEKADKKAEKIRAETARLDAAKADATGSVRRRVEAPREVARAAASPPSATIRPAIEPPAVVVVESGPLVAVPQPEGIITRIVSAAVALTNRTAETSGVPAIGDLAPVTPAMAAKSEAAPVGHVLEAKP